MMTNGPEAEVGEILEVPFARPRRRQGLLESPEYYRLREQLIEFLHVRAYTLKGQVPGGGHAPTPSAPPLNPPAEPSRSLSPTP